MSATVSTPPLYRAAIAAAERKAREAFDEAWEKSRPGEGEVSEAIEDAPDLTSEGPLWKAVLAAEAGLRALGVDP